MIASAVRSNAACAAISYDTGIRFCGSTKGRAVTVAVRRPHSLATFTVLPGTASGVGSQQ